MFNPLLKKRKNFRPDNSTFLPGGPSGANFQPCENQRPQVRAQANPAQVARGGNNQANAYVHAVVEHLGANEHIAVIQTRVEYEGKHFTLLIDFESTHSFISPRCMILLINIPQYLDNNLIVEFIYG